MPPLYILRPSSKLFPKTKPDLILSIFSLFKSNDIVNELLSSGFNLNVPYVLPSKLKLLVKPCTTLFESKVGIEDNAIGNVLTTLLI